MLIDPGEEVPFGLSDVGFSAGIRAGDLVNDAHFSVVLEGSFWFREEVAECLCFPVDRFHSKWANKPLIFLREPREVGDGESEGEFLQLFLGCRGLERRIPSGSLLLQRLANECLDDNERIAVSEEDLAKMAHFSSELCFRTADTECSDYQGSNTARSHSTCVATVPTDVGVGMGRFPVDGGAVGSRRDIPFHTDIQEGKHSLRLLFHRELNRRMQRVQVQQKLVALLVVHVVDAEDIVDIAPPVEGFRGRRAQGSFFEILHENMGESRRNPLTHGSSLFLLVEKGVENEEGVVLEVLQKCHYCRSCQAGLRFPALSRLQASLNDVDRIGDWDLGEEALHIVRTHPRCRHKVAGLEFPDKIVGILDVVLLLVPAQLPESHKAPSPIYPDSSRNS